MCLFPFLSGRVNSTAPYVISSKAVGSISSKRERLFARIPLAVARILASKVLLFLKNCCPMNLAPPIQSTYPNPILLRYFQPFFTIDDVVNHIVEAIHEIEHTHLLAINGSSPTRTLPQRFNPTLKPLFFCTHWYGELPPLHGISSFLTQ